jgi:hypothetical protein
MSADAQAAVLRMPPLIDAAPELAALLPENSKCEAYRTFRAQFVTTKPLRATNWRRFVTKSPVLADRILDGDEPRRCFACQT